MHKLSKDDLKRKSDLIDSYNKAKEAVEEKFKEYEAFVESINEEIRAFNEVVEEMQGWTEDIANEIQEYVDERSDNWRDSDKGQAIGDWLTEWQNFSIDTIDELRAEDVAPDFPDTDEFENLPDEAEV